MPQDPFAQYRVKEQPRTTTTTPIQDDPFKDYLAPESKETGIMDYLTKSILPDIDPAKSLNFDEKNPSKIMKPRGEADTYWEGFSDSLGKTFYDELIQPAGSALGAGLSLLGGPIVRGTLGGLAKIAPGLTKAAGNILSKEVMSGEAPAAVKGIVSELTPKTSKAITTPIPETEIGLPEGAAPEQGNLFAEPPKELTALEKFKTGLQESKEYTRRQRRLLTAERAEKFGKASQVPVTDAESAKSFMSKFSGEHTKVVREPIQMSQTDTDSLIAMIGDNLKAGKISTPEGAQSISAFGKMLSGAPVNNSEIEILSRTFGPEVMELAHTSSMRDMIFRNVSIPKALFSMADLGWPLRQGKSRFLSKEWNTAVIKSIQAYASAGKNKELIDTLKNTRNFDLFRSNGLAVYDNIKTSGAERTLNSVIQNMPGVTHGNRAFNTGISYLRMADANNLFDDYARLYKNAIEVAKLNPNKAVKEQLLKEAEMLNPESEHILRNISDLVNTGTGKGSIGFLEKVAEEVNSVVFSPALISSNVKSIHRVLNPLSYAFKDPVERKYALKQLYGLTKLMVGTATMLNAAGAEINLDMNSSDFLKGKIGKLRFDISHGLGGYFSAPAKILTGVSTSAKTGKDTILNNPNNPQGYNKFDVLTQFGINKESPIASVATSWLRGVEPTGQPVNWDSLNPMENTAAKAAMPGIAQTTYELMQEDPRLLPFLIPSSMGSPVSVYEDEPVRHGVRSRSRKRSRK